MMRKTNGKCPICQPGQIAGFDTEIQCRVSLSFHHGLRPGFTTGFGSQSWHHHGWSGQLKASAERFFVNVFWYQRTCLHRALAAYAWLVWSLAAIAFGYAFFHRVTPSVMVSDLMTEFAIGGAMLGTLSALYFYPYVLLQVPLGACSKVFV